MCQNLFILSRYEITKGAIQRFKFNQSFSDAHVLSYLLIKALREQDWIEKIDYIVPVPITKQKRKLRGFHQCEYIAKKISKSLQIKVNGKNLYRKIDIKDQHLSDKNDRFIHLRAGIFDIKDKNLFQNKNILLLDDVFTTGVTIINCCRALKQTQNINIYVVTLATDFDM